LLETPFNLFNQKEIKRILSNAAQIDSQYELFGAETHRYFLNPPIDASFVRGIENEYGFTLPEDYFRFITEIGDGGAGEDYGIYPFAKYLKKGTIQDNAEYIERYRRGLSKPFTPRLMIESEVEECSFSKEYYDENPERFFVFEKYSEDDDEYIISSDGFFVLGTHGCQWDYGIIISGERLGQIFDTDNEGAYLLLADSFTEFYQKWLNRISNEDNFRRELEVRRELFRNRS